MDYKHVFQKLPEPYIIFKANAPDFTFVEVNDAHVAMTGISREAIIGHNFFDVFPDTSEKFVKTGVSDVAGILTEVITKKETVRLDAVRYDIPGPDGSFVKKYWQTIHYPLLDAKGNVEYILLISKDLTDRQSVTDQLRDTQYSLDLALEAGSIALWNWDVQKNVVTGSLYLARFFGVSEDDAKEGIPIEVFTSAIHEDDRERVVAQIQASLGDAVSFESEYRTISRDGTVRWVIARGRLEHDTEGTLTHFPGLIIDITLRKQAEFNALFIGSASRLLSTSLDYKKTIETVAQLAVPDIADWCTVTMASDDGKLEQVAIAHKDPEKIEWARQYGSQKVTMVDDPNEMSARVIRTGEPEFYPEITDEMLLQLAHSEEEAQLARNLELRSVMVAPLHVQGKNIGVVTLILSGDKRRFTQDDFLLAQELADRMSLAISNARLYGMSIKEIEQRKKLQRQLRQTNQELEQRVERRTAQLRELNLDLERSNGELQNFAYVASHDLQEPLRKIQAFGDILHDEYGKTLGEGADYLQRMQAAANRMSKLIEDLLSFSRVTTNANSFVPVDLNKVLSDVVEDLSERVSRTKGTLIQHPLPTMDGDETQLRQLLQNLIANALKFHRPDVPPVVTIDGTVKDDWLTLSVEDNGIGFDQKYTDRIFAVFQRLHGKEEYEGTGIGLAVCRKIVERHGGTIEATSKPGKGSRFVVSLPLKNTATREKEASL